MHSEQTSKYVRLRFKPRQTVEQRTAERRRIVRDDYLLASVNHLRTEEEVGALRNALEAI
jgi:hypothetical protein